MRATPWRLFSPIPFLRGKSTKQNPWTLPPQMRLIQTVPFRRPEEKPRKILARLKMPRVDSPFRSPMRVRTNPRSRKCRKTAPPSILVVARQKKDYVCIFQATYARTSHSRPSEDGKLRDIKTDLYWLTVGEQHILPKPTVWKYPPLPINIIYT